MKSVQSMYIMCHVVCTIQDKFKRYDISKILKVTLNNLENIWQYKYEANISCSVVAEMHELQQVDKKAVKSVQPLRCVVFIYNTYKTLYGLEIQIILLKKAKFFRTMVWVLGEHYRMFVSCFNLIVGSVHYMLCILYSL